MSDAELPGWELPLFGSERLSFRPFTIGDAEAAFEIFGDPKVMRYSVSGQDQNLEATTARVERYARQNAESGFAPWAIVEMGSESLVGLCGLMRVKDTNDVEIAYRLRRDCWGKGIATEAARAWLDCAFSQLRLPRIVAFVDSANTSSVGVLIKLGMRFLEDCSYEGMRVRKYQITNPNIPSPPTRYR